MEKLYTTDDIGNRQIELLELINKRARRIANNIIFFFWFFVGWWLIGIPVLMGLGIIFN